MDQEVPSRLPLPPTLPVIDDQVDRQGPVDQAEALEDESVPETGLDRDIARGTETSGRDADLEATDSDVAQDPLSGAIPRD